MAERVTIDVEARFQDHLTSKVKNAVAILERFASTKVFVRFNADNSPFLKVVRKAEQQARKFGNTKLAARLDAIDKATQKMGKVWNFGLKIGGAVWRATVSVIDKASAPLRGIFRLLKNPVLQTGRALGLNFRLPAMLETSSDFDATMSQVKAISWANDAEMTALRAKAKEMGATTKFTASEAGSAMTYMAMAGWKSQDMLDGIEGIMNLAAASGEDLAKTSDIVTDALTAFGQTAKDSTHFADVMAAASANANTNVALLGESFKYVAPVAGSFGFSIEDTAVALGLMANAGVKGSMSGTALRGAFTSMLSPSKNAAAAMEKYGVSLARSDGSSKSLMEIMENLRGSFGNMGVDILDSAGELKDFETIMAEAETATGDSAHKLEKLTALSQMFGQRALPGMLAIIQAGAGDFDKLSYAIEHAEGTASRMATTMMDNLKGSMDILKSAAEGVILTIMEKVTPHLRKFVDWLATKMPEIGKSVGNALDFVGTKISDLTEKISKITRLPAFKAGDIGDKIRLLWEGLVVDPLADWWNSGGREQAIESAGNIGQELGEILRSGLLAIFGMTDVLDGSVDAGASIAKSFAKGFLEGFDIAAILKGLWQALGNIWNALPAWGKALIGGKLVGLVSKGILGAAQALGSASAGTGLLGFGAKTAILLGAGNLAGGVTAGAGVIHAGKAAYRAYQGYKEGDEVKMRANRAEAVSTTAGLGAGAAIGAAAGAHFLGIGAIPGALIGAGVGAAAGWFGGNRFAKNIEAAQYKTEEMQEAVKDTSLSAEELARIFQKEVYADMKSRFGEITLSLREIQKLSDQVAWGDQIHAANSFLAAQENAANSRQIFQATAGETDKWMWKARLGVVFDESEKQEILHAFDSYIQSASDYVSNKHSEFTTAVSLLFDVDAPEGANILETGNAYFKKIQEELAGKTQELSQKLNEYLADGKLEAQYDVDGTLILDEAAAIQDLQQQIAAIMQKVSDSEFEAQLDLIKLKFGDGKLSLESFDSFLTQLDSSIQSRMDTGEQAYVTIAAAAKLQYKDGQISMEEYERQIQAAADAYNVQIDELRVKVEDIALDIIGDAYPEIDKAQLQKALEDSLKAGIDPIDWSDEQTAKFLNVQGLTAATADGIRQKLSGVAGLLAKFGLTITPNFQVETDSSFRAKLADSLEVLEPALKIDANIEANWQVLNVGDEENKILALVSPDKQYVVPISALAEANWTTGGDPFHPELLSPDGEQHIPVDAVAELIWSAVSSGNFDTSAILPTVTEPVETTVPVETNVVVADGEGVDSAAITSQIPASTDPVGVTVPVDATYSANAFPGEAETFSIQPLYEFPTSTEITPDYNVIPKFSGDKETFGIKNQYSANTTVGIQVHYNVTKDPLPNLTSGVKKARGGLVGSNGSMGFSDGGMVRGGAQLITVAEEGSPEMIIPLGSQRRERGVKLWKTAGRMLGIDGFATGGIVGASGRMAEPFAQAEMLFFPGLLALQAQLLQQNRIFSKRGRAEDEDESEPVFRLASGRSETSQSGENTVVINLGGITIQVETNGDSADNSDILTAIESKKQEIAELLAGVLKQAMEEVFANTPLRGGGSL